MNQADVAASFRFNVMLLAAKVGAGTVPLDDIRDRVMAETNATSVDEIISRILADAISLGLWDKSWRHRR